MKKNKGLRKINAIFQVLIIIAFASSLLVNPFLEKKTVKARTTFKWTQNNWTEGISSENANHNENQENWKKFLETSKSIRYSDEGILSLKNPEQKEVKQDTEEDFDLGNFNQTISIGREQESKILLDITPADIWESNNQYSINYLPEKLGAGSYIVYVSQTNQLFALKGENTSSFFKYDFNSKTWSNAPSLPNNVSSGGFLLYPGSGNHIYAFVGGLSTAFLRFSISQNQWQSLQPIPGAISYGGSMVYVNNEHIYAIRGGGTRDFFRYSISQNTWQKISDTPESNFGGSLVYPGSGDYIYVFKGNNIFWRYSISQNSWENLESIPDNPESISSLYLDNYIYVTTGSSRSNFWRYSISENSWELLRLFPCALPSSAEKQSIFTIPNSNQIYVNLGTGDEIFWYSISENKWDSSIICSPRKIGVGGNSIYIENTNHIYVLRGGLSQDFWRYSVSQDTWQTLTNAPDNIGAGSAMAHVENYIYVIRGAGSRTFWRYSINQNEWENLANTPAAINYGGTLIYPGFGDYIYATQGNITNAFWRYSISQNTWTILSSLPANLYYGASITYPGKGSFIYLLRGTNSNTLWRYNINENKWENFAQAPDIVRHGGSIIHPKIGSNFYVLAGGGTHNFWKYSLTEKNWTTLSRPTGKIGDGASMVYVNNGNYLYVLRGDNSSVIFKYQFTNGFYNSGTFTSSSLDLRPYLEDEKKIEIENIIFNFEKPENTEIKIQISSSLDGNSWSDFIGPDCTTGSYYTLASENICSLQKRDTIFKYRVYLLTQNPQKSPSFDNFSLKFSLFFLEGFIISSPYDTTSKKAKVEKIDWEKSTSQESRIKIQLRTASKLDENGGDWTGWMGPDGTSNSYFENDEEKITIPEVLKDGVNDRWIQYKVLFSSEERNSIPSLSKISISYSLDKEPPIISNLKLSQESENYLELNWETDEDSSTKIIWGITPSDLTEETEEIDINPPVKNHSQKLENLVECTTYFLKAKSKDEDENEGISELKRVTTKGCLAKIIENKTLNEKLDIQSKENSLNLEKINLEIPKNLTENSHLFVQIKKIDEEDIKSKQIIPSGKKLAKETIYDIKVFSNPKNQLTTFQKPIKITINYQQEENVNEESVSIYHFHNSQWKKLENCNKDTTEKKISCETKSLSIFAVLYEEKQIPSQSTGSNSSITYSGGGGGGSILITETKKEKQETNLFPVSKNEEKKSLGFYFDYLKRKYFEKEVIKTNDYIEKQEKEDSLKSNLEPMAANLLEEEINSLKENEEKEGLVQEKQKKEDKSGFRKTIIYIGLGLIPLSLGIFLIIKKLFLIKK